MISSFPVLDVDGQTANFFRCDLLLLGVCTAPGIIFEEAF